MAPLSLLRPSLFKGWAGCSLWEARAQQAVADGAQIIALPEMSISGYTLNKEIWRYSEPVNGPTEKWLKATARRHEIHLSAGLTQNQENDFYNTYLVAGPDGEILGRVRKTQTEFNIHKAGTLESHIVNTSLGHVGIGICAETHKTFFPRYMRDQDIDFLILPHAWPTPYRPSRLIKETDIYEQEENANNYGRFYADLMGVPTVFVNQVGPIEGGEWPGILGKLMDLDYFRYPGFTTIAEPGVTRSQLHDQEGYIIADVSLSDKKSDTPIPNYDGNIRPGNPFFRKVILGIDIPWGKYKYRKNNKERQKVVKDQ